MKIHPLLQQPFFSSREKARILLCPPSTRFDTSTASLERNRFIDTCHVTDVQYRHLLVVTVVSWGH